MANYHLEVNNIGRRKHKSLAKLVNYITGYSIYDSRNKKTYNAERSDVLYHGIFLPDNAPKEFMDIQTLCTKIDEAEHRVDARTAREFIGSLPNELCEDDIEKIVYDFISKNFISCGLAAIAAIHSGRNESDPAKNNPHVHILVTTRRVTPDGLSKEKFRDFDRFEYIDIWRESWAEIQNQAYRDRGLDIEVSCKNLEEQGIERKPIKRLSLTDWQREERGERTAVGDINRAIKERSRREEQREHDIELSR